MKLLILVFILSLTSCSLIKVPENSGADNISEKQIDSCIKNYEFSSHKANKNCEYTEQTIGELYAIKSSFYAQNNPTYYGTRAFVGVGGDLLFQTSKPAEWATGVVFLLLTPFTFVGDTIYYPVQVYDHLSVPEQNIESALFYLEKARKNGYTDVYMDFIPSFVPVKNLDK